MKSAAFKVLLVEDNPIDAELARAQLSSGAGQRFDVKRVERLADAIELLHSSPFDVVLLDLGLPDCDGLDTVRRVCAACSSSAVVVVTGLVDEEVGLQAVREGASDFLVKGQITRQLLVRSIRYAIERKRSEEAVLLLASLVESSEDAILSITPDGLITSWNHGAERLFGHRADEVIGRSLATLIPPDRAAELGWTLETVRKGERIRPYETVRQRKDGTPVEVSLSVAPIAERNGRISGASVIAQDRTEHRRLEGRLRQAQKMEAVSRLAGGVAHDFNNLMTTVTGFTELLLNQLPAGEPSRELLRIIKRAGERAAQLTQKMLAFSRRQILTFKVVDLNALVRGMEPALRRQVLPGGVELELDLDPGLGTTKADPPQLEEVILNLVVNSRDAMPAGGKLTIRTRNVELPGDAEQGVPAGPYVLLRVTDTGCGMDAHTKAHLFEPFFTTKEVDKGTGLGLPAVYGTVKQSGGHITCDSGPGQGTTFEVYLPRVAADAAAAPAAEGPRGGTTVLVVEDEEGVRGLVRYVLENNGYRVLEARDGPEALTVVRRHAGTIELLLTDVVMPQMSGRELADRFVPLAPGAKVLFMSGYAEDEVFRAGVSVGAREFLAKPFPPQALVQKVREILGG